jgi:membrane-associated protease RseP (regulator of RpoE activity)
MGGMTPGGGGRGIPVAFLVFAVLALFFLLGSVGAEAMRHPASSPQVPLVVPAPRPLPDIPVSDLMTDATQHRVGSALVVEGHLRGSPSEAARTLAQRYQGSGWTPLLTESERGGAAVLMLPLDLAAGADRPQRVWINGLLLVATLLTTTWAGALHQGVNLLHEPSRFAVGLPYALGLMAILAAHELGHYFTARYHKIAVTLPYFIPIPFALGTFGAFIRILSPARDRRGLFDMAVTGPYAGLVLAIPALLIGLPMSHVVTLPPGAHVGASIGGGVSLESSLLLTVLAKLSMGNALDAGNAVLLHPLAFAGWLGLLVTALNLLPIGQLDGGHMADAMFGRRASAHLSSAAIVVLVVLGLFVWSGLLFWAFIAFFIAGRKGLPPLNDIDRLGPGRLAAGWLAFGILAAILMPVPHALLETLCSKCPYL